jgi:dTDP-4-amino-4,6-dideoxygalactose transaminase
MPSMNVPIVDLKAQYASIKTEIDTAIQGVLDNTSFIGGTIITDFEASFAQYLDVAHCVSCANGTDAIEIALQAMGIGAGDEVIVPAMSWIATSEAVTTVGAKPVFVDILPGKFTIDPKQIRSKISDKTKAIIPVHLYGRPCEMDEIMNIAREFNLKVLEDSAQAHGAIYNNQKIGSFGDAATFSFYPGKNLGAYGDAGCIVTNNKKLAQQCKMICNHGQLSKHNHQIEGRNSRMDTLQAAVLNTKLPYLDEWTNKRIENAKYYNELLKDTGISIPVIEDAKCAFHLYVINIKNRDEVKSKLQEMGIGTQIHYPNALPALKPYQSNNDMKDFPVADKLAKEGLSLPLFPELTKEQIEYVAGHLLRLMEK